MQQLTLKNLTLLTDTWKKNFSEDIVETNMSKLTSHVEQFYADIVSETEQRQQKILSKISGMCLHIFFFQNNIFFACILVLEKEREFLQTKLSLKQVDNKMPTGMPFFCYQQYLDQSLDELRLQLNERTTLINRMLEEQYLLCTDLQEEQIQLQMDPTSPLPSAEEVDALVEYVEGLKNKKIIRLTQVGELKQDILQLISRLGISLEGHDER